MRSASRRLVAVLIVLACLSAGVFGALAIWSALTTAGPPGSFSDRPCELLTKEEVALTSGSEVSSVTLETTDLGKLCVFRLEQEAEIWVSLQFVSGAELRGLDPSGEKWTGLGPSEQRFRIGAYDVTGTTASASAELLTDMELLAVRIHDLEGSEAEVLRIAEELSLAAAQ